MTDRIYTIGHSTHPVEKFIGLLKVHDVKTLVDIRTIPKSRYNPQFGQEMLKPDLEASGIVYCYMKDLGGLRKARSDSPNGGWRNSSFRGYADYMGTEAFETALGKLIVASREKRVAIMCAEAVPWRCHRSLVADALLTRGWEVLDIMPDGNAHTHKLTKFARVEGQSVTYPPESLELPGL